METFYQLSYLTFTMQVHETSLVSTNYAPFPTALLKPRASAIAFDHGRRPRKDLAMQPAPLLPRLWSNVRKRGSLRVTITPFRLQSTRHRSRRIRIRKSRCNKLYLVRFKSAHSYRQCLVVLSLVPQKHNGFLRKKRVRRSPKIPIPEKTLFT